MRLRFFRLSYLFWLAVPIGLYLAYTIIGLPAVIWSYDWIDEGQGHDPYAARHYTRCTFIGTEGAITTYPTDGHCGWLYFPAWQGDPK